MTTSEAFYNENTKLWYCNNCGKAVTRGESGFLEYHDHSSTEIERLYDVEVKLLATMGDDLTVCQAARVSTVGENKVVNKLTSEQFVDPKRDSGLINYLMKNKHGSPFEHTALQFFVKAPIFVFREFHRHRVGFSYNEMSGRYTKLLPEFYLVPDDRPLINVGTSANPRMLPGNPSLTDEVNENLIEAYKFVWAKYEKLLELGIAKEIARACLPVGLMSQMYVTCNARSMMNFLSLRTHRENAMFVSNPQREIEMVADKMEVHFANAFPWVWKAYNNNGRVAP